MQSTEFLLNMMETWAEQLGDKFPLPPEGRCALVRGQILATAKLVTPETAPVAKPGPRKGAETPRVSGGAA